MSNKTKIILSSAFMWLISVLLFLIISFYSELWILWKYSNSFLNFLDQSFIFVFDFVSTINYSTLALSFVFSLLLAYFYYTYFYISYNKFDKFSANKNRKYGAIGIVFTYLGFGCVACGQTLLYSFLLLIGGTVSTFLSPFIGQLSLIIGCVFLIFALYRNIKIIKSPNICKI